MKTEKDEFIVSRRGVFDMQVCVPKTATNKEIKDFANDENPAGTRNGWFIRKQGDELLGGADERTQCEDDKEKVHIMLDC